MAAFINVPLLVLILTIVSQCCYGFKRHHRCRDWQVELGSKATDGQYILYLDNNIGVSIYCSGMKSTTSAPQEYITLPNIATNKASFSTQVGDKTRCAEIYPAKVYQNAGSTTYRKIAIDIDSLVVGTTDTKFAMKNSRSISYGTAGDMATSGPECRPTGQFSIDLRGTPFAPVKDTRWASTGTYLRGNTTDLKSIINNNTYQGCFRDRSDRLLPGGRHDNDHNNTVENCKRHCVNTNFKYAGLEFGVECHCGNDAQRFPSSAKVEEYNCNKPCSGDSNRICGGTWSIQIYSTAVPQYFVGNCGGYPGQCFPMTLDNPTMQRLQLDIYNGLHICRKNPCIHGGGCIATTGTTYKCQCFDGYSGINCDVVSDINKINSSTCDVGLQLEGCGCQEKFCNGARMDGDMCISSTGNAAVTCRPGNPGHVIVFNVDGYPTASCPDGAEMTGCTFWSNQAYNFTHGHGVIMYGECTACPTCKVQARCKQYICGCENGGTCNKITGQCDCPTSYYGSKCETFDYCTYFQYSQGHGKPTCSNGGICTVKHKAVVPAIAGDMAGDKCLFPFDYRQVTYHTCVTDSTVGPPFACAGDFDGTKSYIDLGQWSPGSKYTIAAWVRPELIDTIRRTVAGGVMDCNDFGFNLNSGTFRGYAKMSKMCTRDLDVGKPVISVGKWYMVAITSNGSHASIFQDGEFKESNTLLLNNLPTTKGFRIGGEYCCPTDYFHGMIKTVKVWNRPMTREEINTSMYTIGTANSTNEAIYGGLVGHWELGDTNLPVCGGPGVVDHGMDDWQVEDGQFIGGIHCNISRFIVPKGVTVTVSRYNGTSGGKLDVTAQIIRIDGYIDALGAGYRGGPTSSNPGESGRQGETYIGKGTRTLTANRGGGGGGIGANSRSDGTGRSGGGGGYGINGLNGYIQNSDRTGLGSGGIAYGDADLNVMYLGSGGGSGGNAKDLTTNPTGGKGGNGGGSIQLLAATSITIKGVVSVAGGNGQGDVSVGSSCLACPASCDIKSPIRCLGNSTTACWDMSGPGGGGSGGSLFLSAKLVDIGYQKLWAFGGDGGAGAAHCCGGAGSVGRIRIDSVILKGIVGDKHGAVKTVKLKDQFVDHSQTGQKQIDYRTTVYGNEVYLGCFKEVSVTNRKLAVKIPLTLATRAKLTPEYCKTSCRQKGYMYSGTQNGNECYCDNHLDRSNKLHESECNLTCSGDPLFKCGGKSKLQIFGPPPSTPAIGYNVATKCQPWCATADADTGTPKVGLCANKDTNTPVKDWTFTCQCPPGKITGPNCDQSCAQWTYGVECRRNCSCIQNNTASCNPENGVCFCKPGFTGKQCQDICQPGFFGQDCTTACNCSQNSQCDRFTGACSCNPGWSGAYCNYPCPPKTYGSGCNLTCSCYHGSCEPQYGICQCNAGYKLPECFERCDPGTYGQNCMTSCDCNKQSCDGVTGLCQCGPGYIGPKCKILCPHGTWGQNCLTKCSCENDFGCDHMTGECNCGPGYEGIRCELMCSSGTFGSNCYGSCPCVSNHTSACDAVDGECSCLPGYYGDNCQYTCNGGYYGFRCKKACTCVNGGTCNPVSGTCLCPAGFLGTSCQVPCTPGMYGDNCQTTCPTTCQGQCNIVNGTCNCQAGQTCKCPANTAGSMTKCNQVCGCTNGDCSATTAMCTCWPGWTGIKCDQPCATGKFGLNCQSTCLCVNGACDPITGNCTCSKGFMGTKCELPCKVGYHGTGCRLKCPTCGPYSTPGCHAVTGSCVCGDGYTGFFCDRPCPKGTYGHNCTQTCSCQSGGMCESTAGKCLCKPGYTGTFCQNKCPKGRWGQDCSSICDCGPHGVGCSPEEGICQCGTGYTGVKCRESCPVNTYGVNCSSTCNCNPAASTCSPIDGKCWCLAGWAGQFCDIGCSRGQWGRNCSQACQCNSHGNCDPLNGQCDCAAGYTGNTCESQCDQDINWGKDCAFLCACNGANCDHITGVCRCPPGKIGHHCERTCDSNHFGFNCAQLCGCKNHGRCDSVTGLCTCQPGWAGSLCTENCPDGYYGVECGQVCQACQNGGSCDSISGRCLCAPDYTGQYCNTTLDIKDGPVTQAQTSVQTSSAFNLTVHQFTGLIVGFVILLILVVVVTILVSRKLFVGKFGGTSGAVKFKGDEVDLGDTRLRPESESTTTGFVNPVHEDVFHNKDLDGKSEGSSGIASGNADSEDEEEEPKFFKDSAA